MTPTPNSSPNRSKVRVMWLLTFVVIGAIFAYIYGDQISAVEDRILTVLFGRRP